MEKTCEHERKNKIGRSGLGETSRISEIFLKTIGSELVDWIKIIQNIAHSV